MLMMLRLLAKNELKSQYHWLKRILCAIVTIAVKTAPLTIVKRSACLLPVYRGIGSDLSGAARHVEWVFRTNPAGHFAAFQQQMNVVRH